MKTILFQGDSITDCNRVRENIASYGDGYAKMLCTKLSEQNPSSFKFLNKGVSGDRIVDVYARAKIDIWNLKPDIISLLIGVNDVWHEFREQPNGVGAQRFEIIYKMLIEHTLQRLPNVNFYIMEPFALSGNKTDIHGFEKFSHEVKLRAQAAKNIAKEYNLPFLELQCVFDEACKKESEEHWLLDGVHPTEAGHTLIAQKWFETFGTLL